MIDKYFGRLLPPTITSETDRNSFLVKDWEVGWKPGTRNWDSTRASQNLARGHFDRRLGGAFSDISSDISGANLRLFRYHQRIGTTGLIVLRPQHTQQMRRYENKLDIERQQANPIEVNPVVIRVRLHGRPRRAAGLDEVEVNKLVRTFRDLLEELTLMLGEGFGRYLFDPATSTVASTVILLVNGHSIKMLEGLETPLFDKDTVTIDSVDILEVVGGG